MGFNFLKDKKRYLESSTDYKHWMYITVHLKCEIMRIREKLQNINFVDPDNIKII